MEHMSDTTVGEIELKLRLGRGAAAKLRRHPALKRYRIGRGAGATLDTIYYDTPDLALARRGWALRIRHTGNGALEQTLKIPRKGGGLQTRGEWNAPLGSEQLDLSLIPDEEPRRWLEAREADPGLIPVFRTAFRRTAWRMGVAGSELELALDEGEILAADRREPILEAELELKQGDPAAVITLARELAETIDLHVDPRSKAERGFALFTGEGPKPRKGARVTLDPDSTAWESFRAVMGSCLEHLLANEAPIRLTRDIEGVHQLRVAIRRLRAALAVFRPVLDPEASAPIAEDLRALQQRFGPARDWDVFLEETMTPMLQRLGPGNGLNDLKGESEGARDASYTDALAVLESATLTDLVLRLEDWLLRPPPREAEDVSVRVLARKVLRQRLRKVRKAVGQGPMTLREDELHALRIEIKKLRYAGEFFRSLYPTKKIGKLLERAATLQDCLGGLNDAVVAKRLMESLPPSGPHAGPAALLLSGWQEGRIAAQLPGLEISWSRFLKTDVPW